MSGLSRADLWKRIKKLEAEARGLRQELAAARVYDCVHPREARDEEAVARERRKCLEFVRSLPVL